MDNTVDIQDERMLAVKRLRKKADFRIHLTGYVVVMAALVVTWALTTAPGFFWPAFPMLGWGIGVLFHGLDVFRREPTAEEIKREVGRLHHGGIGS